MRPDSLRRRLQALRMIPERLRTDAQWDELNELEIQLAPGNRPEVASAANDKTWRAPAAGPARTGERPAKNSHPSFRRRSGGSRI